LFCEERLTVGNTALLYYLREKKTAPWGGMMGTVGLTGLNNDPQFWHAALYIIHLTMLLAVAVPRNIPLALLLALAREGAALAWTSGR